MLTPPIWSKRVACPIHVTVVSPAFALRNAASGFKTSKRYPPGGVFGSPSRHRSHCHFQKLPRGTRETFWKPFRVW